MEDDAFLHFLLRIAKENNVEKWVLFPLQDEVVEFVARNCEQLAKCYQLVTQDWQVLQWAQDKRLTYHMAEELGVPFPQTWYPGSENDLKTLGITFPVIIKPAISIHFQHSLRLKALPVHNYEELLLQYRLTASVIDPDEIMIQEIIPGAGCSQYSVATYCKEGHIILSMMARRTRQYPIDYGLSSSFVEAMDVPVLQEPAGKLLHFMRVSGMVEVEFKHDLRDDQYKLLDINVRPWGWHTLCIDSGLDFPHIQYLDVLGYEPTSIKPCYGRHWVRLLTDIPAGLQEIRAGITSPGAYIRSLRGKTVFSVFDWHDPLPALGDFAVALSRSIRGFNGKA
jgi:predicted ATP-grasp superfamily ATP-dependent carboligase